MFGKLILICLLIGINSSNCLQLERLCSKSLFVYKGVECNSIHRIQLNRTFPAVSSFMIDENDYQDYFNSTEETKKMISIKNTYNDKIMDIYNDYYINTKKYDNILDDNQIIKSIYEIVLNDLEKNVNHKYLSMFNKYTKNRINKGFEFSRILAYNYINKFDIDNNENWPYKLKLLLDGLKFDENITMAFQNDHINRIYNFAILSKPTFIFSSGTLISDIILPVNDSNYENVTTNCLDLDKLPKFYHQFKKEN